MSHVLIVDDDVESRQGLREALTDTGHQVSEAGNGVDALAYARHLRPDLVVSDILMPQMDGFALCRACKADPALQDAPFVFYAATWASGPDEALARRLGATRFLIKPMADAALVGVLRDVLDERERADGPRGEPDLPREVESWRLYNEALIRTIETRLLDLHGELRQTREVGSAASAIIAAVAQSPLLVSLSDTHGRIGYVNARFEQVTGYTLDEIRGQTHARLRASHGDAGPDFEIRATVLAGAEWKGEFEQRKKSGERYWERASISPVRNADGEVAHFLRLAEDITAPRQAQEARDMLQARLLETERLESVGRLAGGVAHDFNNLLTVVIGHAHLLLQDLAPTDPMRADVTAMLDAATRGSTITTQLLTFARKDVVHPVVIDPADALGALGQMIQRVLGPDIRLGMSLAPDAWPVRIDPARFDQMLLNLVANARDAIAGHGVVDVSLTNMTLSRGAGAAHGGLPAGSYVAVRVADSGRGIEPAALPRIYEPFFTTKPRGEGTGLGLSSVVGTVEQAGGHVQVERTGPQGTAFLVLLPRSNGRPSPGPPDTAVEALHGSERILLVEDEPAVLDLLRRKLEAY
ncbi:MAG: response regulator, partial [Luteitalea sp.]